MDNRKDKRTVWIYAVVLFTSAFIVLMITAYSQIKVNKNIDDVRNKLGDTEKEKSDFKMNLSSALVENKKLNEEINSLENELEEARKVESKLKQELNKSKDTNSTKIDIYEKLMLANIKYDNRDLKSCALILLNEIDKESLDKNALDMYKRLSELSFKKASLEFYADGYDFYKKGLYQNAIESLKNSLTLESTEYYSDDCHYFLAYSHLNMGNKLLAKESMNILLTDYPDSTYKSDAIDFIKINFGQ